MSTWWAELTALEKVFTAMAFPFTLLTILQLILELTGIGADHGAHDADSGGAHFDFSGDAGGFLDHFSFFSVRNLIYFLMMFGWVGLACSKAGIPSFFGIPIGIAAGLLTTVIIAWVFYTMSRLTETGNINISNAVGTIGTVYIPIPAEREGSGVVQVVLQGVTTELDAYTDGEKLSTGATIRVLEVLGANKILVAKSTAGGELIMDI